VGVFNGFGLFLLSIFQIMFGEGQCALSVGWEGPDLIGFVH